MSTKKQELDQQLVRDLAGILDETNLTEIEIEQGDHCRTQHCSSTSAARIRPVSTGLGIVVRKGRKQ